MHYYKKKTMEFEGWQAVPEAGAGHAGIINKGVLWSKRRSRWGYALRNNNNQQLYLMQARVNLFTAEAMSC